jgi:hypothetical protein
MSYGCAGRPFCYIVSEDVALVAACFALGQCSTSLRNAPEENGPCVAISCGSSDVGPSLPPGGRAVYPLPARTSSGCSAAVARMLWKRTCVGSLSGRSGEGSRVLSVTGRAAKASIIVRSASLRALQEGHRTCIGACRAPRSDPGVWHRMGSPAGSGRVAIPPRRWSRAGFSRCAHPGLDLRTIPFPLAQACVDGMLTLRSIFVYILRPENPAPPK